MNFWHLKTLSDIRSSECLIELLLIDNPQFPQKSAWIKAGFWSTWCSDPLHYSVHPETSVQAQLYSMGLNASLSLVDPVFLSFEMSEGWPRPVVLDLVVHIYKKLSKSPISRPYSQVFQFAFIFGWNLNMNIFKRSPNDSSVQPAWRTTGPDDLPVSISKLIIVLYRKPKEDILKCLSDSAL